MAKREDAILQGNNVALERDRYTLRVKEAKFGESKSSGKPMVTLVTEIVAPRIVTQASGMQAKIEGMEVIYYLPCSKENLANMFSLWDKLGNRVDEIDEENPEIQWMNGKFFDAVLSSEEQFLSKKDATTGKYEPILDASGQKISRGYKPQAAIFDIIGEVPPPAN